MLATILVVLGTWAEVKGQDTIQSGTLRPLETLPSLGPTLLAPPSAPGLGTGELGIPGMASGPGTPASVLTPASPTPGMPSTLAPGAPLSPMTPAALGPVPASATTPPPLPGESSQVIKEPIAQAYLYVEPYQTRFEVLFDAATLLAWLSPDTPVPDTLTPEFRQQVREKAAARSAGWCTMSCSDNALPAPQLLVEVIKGLPGNTVPLKDEDPVALNQAMVGFMWDFSTPPAPADLTVTWNGWINGRTRLPIRTFFGTQSEAGEMNATVKTYRWRNLDRLPRPAPLAAVPQWERAAPVRFPLGGALWLLGGLVFYVVLKIKNHRLPGGSTPYLAVWVLGAVLMSQLLVVPLPMGGSVNPGITEVADAQRIVSPLLRNVYRAFDHRSESDVYDVLERSVEGELLRRLYLETIQALTLEGREGTRVNITEFQVTVDKVAPNPGGEGFVADCNWMARGLVGHWGHSHSRLNIYNARLTLVPVQDEWKLTGLEVQEVRRL